MPSCGTNSLIYYITGSTIYNWNPALPFSATNPVPNSIAPPAGANSLSFCENINDPTAPSPTFYTVVNGNYTYYNGTTWVNTGHVSGSINIGGGGGYIYGMVGGTSPGGLGINHYDGTGNATFLVDVPNYNGGGPADLQAESPDGSFYVVKIASPAWLRKYSSTGTLIQEWTIIGGPGTGAGGGFAVVNNTLYSLCLGAGLWSGPIGATTINLTEITGVPATLTAALDFAACSGSLAPLDANDTLYFCNNTGTVTASGTASYSYNVLNGNATLTGSGPNYNVTLSTASTVLLHSTAVANGNTHNLTDTFLIIPPPVIDAGPDDTLMGCAAYTGQLIGTITNTAPWVTYNSMWTPAATITTGANTLTPTIQPTATGYYVLTVSTGSGNGNCSLRDSVKITTIDRTVTTDFSYNITNGCVADTVVFTNNSQHATHYTWNFGDGSLPDTTTNPTHIYTTQNVYNVNLVAGNGTCNANVTKSVDVQHPLAAMFNTDKDSLCEGGTIVFTDASTVTKQPAQYHWDFGDGGSSDMMSPTYTYNSAGSFQVRLILNDAIPCYDTAYHTITVDSIPSLSLQLDKRSICAGELVNYNAVYSQQGIKGLVWDFGDGTVFSNTNNVKHAFDREGTFWVNLSADYRICPDLNLSDSVVVHPYPKVDLGPDTTLCLHGNPILLANQVPNSGNVRYQWNNGDTTATSMIQHDGIYQLTVSNSFDCSTTDEIEIKKDCYTDIPNSFTPNGDGVNDYFFPRQLLSQGVVGFSMQVFNRWGQVIFETANANGRGWDGKFNEKEQPQGVYIYQIQVALKNGRSENYKGNVTLIR
ncbi:PKD domain-containing protein [Taibaiella lutea]|nr:PKD domain-containing protein [Taibaiella lutea]